MGKYSLRPHMRFEIECLGAKWHSERGQWEVRFRDLRSKLEYSRYATILVSAVGGISKPREVKFKGMERFQGEIFHTAEWNHEYDYTDKRMAIIGNGCSAAQVVPAVCGQVESLKQFVPPFTEHMARVWILKQLPSPGMPGVRNGIMSVPTGFLARSRNGVFDISRSGSAINGFACSWKTTTLLQLTSLGWKLPKHGKRLKQMRKSIFIR